MFSFFLTFFVFFFLSFLVFSCFSYFSFFSFFLLPSLLESVSLTSAHLLLRTILLNTVFRQRTMLNCIYCMRQSNLIINVYLLILCSIHSSVYCMRQSDLTDIVMQLSILFLLRVYLYMTRLLRFLYKLPIVY